MIDPVLNRGNAPMAIFPATGMAQTTPARFGLDLGLGFTLRSPGRPTKGVNQ